MKAGKHIALLALLLHLCTAALAQDGRAEVARPDARHRAIAILAMLANVNYNLMATSEADLVRNTAKRFIE